MLGTFERYQTESKQLHQIRKNPPPDTLPLDVIFPTEFMQRYTQFDSIYNFFTSGGFVINSEEDYESIPDAEIDAYVTKTTQYSSWKEMLLDAVDRYKDNSLQQ